MEPRLEFVGEVGTVLVWSCFEIEFPDGERERDREGMNDGGQRIAGPAAAGDNGRRRRAEP